MDSDPLFPKIESIFWQAAELIGTERQRFLDRQCAGDADLLRFMKRLLENFERHRHLTSVAPTLKQADPATTVQPERVRAMADHVGHYRLLGKIGEGGMGEVWEAEQQSPVRRRVALKVIKWGLDSRQVIARFESERQALALLDHENVARVFDGGVTEDGRPFFVMELVHGVPVTEYCDRHKLSGPERLELFMRICDGVSHAHQRGIIHRDLKPTNVLVMNQDGRPTPKIIDFGVAKATTQRLTERTLFTELGQIIGTPEYMSPEQADLTAEDVDTRTDVYSLGVMLYELLVGALPFDSRELRRAGFDEIRRRIRTEEPQRPSTRVRTLGADSNLAAENRGMSVDALGRMLRRDLDWITMKALEKDRVRRYESASELKGDIGRFLRHEPALAGPPSALYRTGKFVRRHRVAVAGISAVLLAIIGGSIGTTTGMVKARRAERIARDEAAVSREVTDFLVSLFKVPDPSESRGASVTAREIIDRGAEQIRYRFRDRPAIRSRLLDTMGFVYGELGLQGRADSLLSQALDEQERLLGPNHPDVATTLEHLATVSFFRLDFRRATALADRCLSIRRVSLPPDSPDLARAMTMRAGIHIQMGDYGAADSLLGQAVSVFERSPDSPAGDLASALAVSGISKFQQGSMDESIPLHKRALEVLERAYGPVHPEIYANCMRLGEMLLIDGQLDDSQRYLDQARTVGERVYPPHHFALYRVYLCFGEMAMRRGQPRTALSFFELALASSASESSANPARATAEPLWGLGRACAALGRRDDARRYLEQSLSGMALADNGNAWHWHVPYHWACRYALLGDHEAAMKQLRVVADSLAVSEWVPSYTMARRAGPGTNSVARDPDLASLHSDPEFWTLASRMAHEPVDVLKKLN